MAKNERQLLLDGELPIGPYDKEETDSILNVAIIFDQNDQTLEIAIGPKDDKNDFDTTHISIHDGKIKIDCQKSEQMPFAPDRINVICPLVRLSEFTRSKRQ